MDLEQIRALLQASQEGGRGARVFLPDDTEMWAKHAQAKDLAGFKKHYASDAVVMIPHMPALKGMDNIKKS